RPGWRRQGRVASTGTKCPTPDTVRTSGAAEEVFRPISPSLAFSPNISSYSRDPLARARDAARIGGQPVHHEGPPLCHRISFRAKWTGATSRGDTEEKGMDVRSLGAEDEVAWLAARWANGRLSRRDVIAKMIVLGLSVPAAVQVLEACGGQSPSPSGSSTGQ